MGFTSCPAAELTAEECVCLLPKQWPVSSRALRGGGCTNRGTFLSKTGRLSVVAPPAFGATLLGFPLPSVCCSPPVCQRIVPVKKNYVAFLCVSRRDMSAYVSAMSP